MYSEIIEAPSISTFLIETRWKIVLPIYKKKQHTFSFYVRKTWDNIFQVISSRLSITRSHLVLFFWKWHYMRLDINFMNIKLFVMPIQWPYLFIPRSVTGRGPGVGDERPGIQRGHCRQVRVAGRVRPGEVPPGAHLAQGASCSLRRLVILIFTRIHRLIWSFVYIQYTSLRLLVISE